MFYIYPNPDVIAERLSRRLVAIIQKKPHAVLGLATGSTMKPIYAAFVAQVQQQMLDISQVTTFNLDEYIGLTADHPQSYYQFMQEYLFQPAGIQAHQISLPNGINTDLASECANYSGKIQQAGGLDVQLLGIGTNGHIGFNEPGTAFSSRTHVVELSENTRLDNSRFFASLDEMPTEAITMGIQDIMDAKEVILVATGAHKADVMAQLYTSAIDEQMPASVLKRHANIHIWLDQAAAEQLPTDAKVVFIQG